MQKVSAINWSGARPLFCDYLNRSRVRHLTRNCILTTSRPKQSRHKSANAICIHLNVHPVTKVQISCLSSSSILSELANPLGLDALKMAKFTNRDFKDAMEVLRCLQSNRAAIDKTTLSSEEMQRQKLESNKEMLDKLGITADDIKRMNIVHVAGTKGKGSTCAMVEKVLRKEGQRTGLFTSPHLINVQERIQVNGYQMSETEFAKYFWQVYDQLEPFIHKPNSPLFYFGFMTMMALHVFKCLKVNAAIIEVGIGGEFDTTNVIQYPFITAITSLGLDHTQMLGNTIDKIAWHKSGIFRPNVPAFSSSNQNPIALKVLQDRAIERQCPLYVVPELKEYPTDCKALKIGLSGPIQHLNTSLALQICQHFVNHVHQRFDTNYQNILKASLSIQTTTQKAEPFELSPNQVKALQYCRWHGRFEVLPIKFGPLDDQAMFFYLDGAHTRESLEYCAQWFHQHSVRSNDCNRKKKRILVFFCTGDRKPSELLPALDLLTFDEVHFAPHCLTEEQLWDGMLDKIEQMKSVYQTLHSGSNIQTHKCFKSCFDLIVNQSIAEHNIDVLMTGSLYLIGSCYKLLDQRVQEHFKSTSKS